MDYIAFNIILDDLVFPDGKTCMGVLGGGGPQTAFGMRLWSESVGLVGGIGPDFPVEAVQWLQDAGIDQEGVRRSSVSTPRAWQVMEVNGRRTQAWRVNHGVLAEQLRRTMERLPERYRQAKGYHFGIHPNQPDDGFMDGLHSLGKGVVSVETFRRAAQPPAPDELARLLGAADVFSLNWLEAVSLLDAGEPLDVVRALIRSGARVLALRMGADGSLVADAGTGRVYHIPAVQTTVVDPVGAGNAYCGGFLVGWCERGDLLTAGLYGAVSASFLVEQVGLPAFSAGLLTEAQRRLRTLQDLVTVVEI